MTTTVLLINTIFTIWASFHFGLNDGIGIVYQGDCGVVTAWSLGLHLLINILSSALFGASNYTMQCLMATTREECDIAHARGDWLDIGCTSFRNLTRISWRRRIAWALLALSSVPIHFLYNSAIFKELYDIENAQLFAVSAGILRTDDIDFQALSEQLSAALSDTGAKVPESQSQDWYGHNTPKIAQLRSLYLADQAAFVRLEAQQCVDVYSSDLLTEHSHVFAIVDPRVQTNTSYSNPSDEYSNLIDEDDLGMFSAEAEDMTIYWPSNITDIGNKTQRDSYSQSWVLAGMYLDSCVAKRELSYCKLQFSMYILVVIIVCNLIKTSVMIWHLWHQESDFLVTFGDALAGWLRDVDENTAGNCLTDKSSVRDERDDRFDRLATQPQKLSLGREGAARDPQRLSIQQAIATGKFFVEDTTSTLKTELPTDGTEGFIASVLLVNTPQIGLSCCYLGYNGILTSMHLAYEFSGYAVDRKGLRVTEPRGAQRSTYWLQLPFRYSLPLLAATALLHWLISQSLFLIRVVPYRAELSTQTLEALTADKSGVGISLVPMLAGVVLALCMLLIVMGLGFRKLASNMPIAGSCSFALAAAAHRPQEDEKASTLPLMWGEIFHMGTEDLGHCSFTSEEVVEVEPNRKYAGSRQSLTA
ncbi:hypothetical protein CKM354_000134300 [Cercospora kikuchii]|uniref:DUF6536 domain-containing protein n=1 Tax=Cercospora kikuchii TaxID=84275 RepID=A0A9P3C5L9_9PEZI|nr:uncharacterized protein CKM354_000134300 [Cercospora kikuchii]GIZ37914.1 hypothetical protein CKM354_000134300 [Cercospora kikuchii]